MENIVKENESIAWELFRNCEYAVVAVIDQDGYPYCIPISPIVMNETIYFHSSNKGNLKAIFDSEPRVSINCVGKTKLVPEKFTTAYESAIGSGYGEFLTEDNKKSHYF